VPNKYPALVADLPDDAGGTGGPRRQRAARGHHEVIVEGPDHRPRLAPDDAAVVREALMAGRERLRWLASRQGLASGILFKNHGPRAGASLEHPHWQLAAIPVIPATLHRMLDVARAYHSSRGGSVYTDLLADEVAAGTRIVATTEDYVTLTPYAPQWPGETWVLPRRGGGRFESLEDDAVSAFAAALHDALRRVARIFDDPDCNVAVYSAPFASEAGGGFSWHVRIQPRLTVPGGFELATGMAITVLAPEDAAAALRDVEV
jgi:UDPglucose--hexose-1-phosphate uridylyltransferase